MSPARPRVLVVCASECNRRGMERPGPRRLAEPVFHDYDDRLHRALLEGEAWASERERRDPGCFDLERLVAEVVDLATAHRVAGLVVSHDYPGALVASLAARHLGLPGPPPAVVVACQHKYLGRRLQARIVPQATPRFARLPTGRAPGAGGGEASPLPLPAFAKPVRGNFSFASGRVATADELEVQRRACRFPEAYLRPLAQALELTAGEEPLASLLAGEGGAAGDPDGGLRPGGDDGVGDLLIEEPLAGEQLTVEAIAAGGRVELLAVVDSRFLPGTLSFSSFRYPSSLPPAVQRHAFEIARRLADGMGFRDGLFNVEMIHHPASGALHVVEVNPRMCSQWADLMERVDGVNTYEHAVRVALGLPVAVPRGAGPCRVAASFPLRSAEDRRVAWAPTPEEVAAAEARVGEVEAYVHAEAGRRLSEIQQVQDAHTWCYGRVNLGAGDEAELEAKLAAFLEQAGPELVPADAAAGSAHAPSRSAGDAPDDPAAKARGGLL